MYYLKCNLFLLRAWKNQIQDSFDLKDFCLDPGYEATLHNNPRASIHSCICFHGRATVPETRIITIWRNYLHKGYTQTAQGLCLITAAETLSHHNSFLSAQRMASRSVRVISPKTRDGSGYKSVFGLLLSTLSPLLCPRKTHTKTPNVPLPLPGAQRSEGHNACQPSQCMSQQKIRY